jgi:hypothetical protein
MAEEELDNMGNCLFEHLSGAERRVDFAVAGEKCPIHIVIRAPLSTPGISAILYRTHLSANLDIDT